MITFKAEFPRKLGLTVRYDPIHSADEDNDAHALVLGKKPGKFINAVKYAENIQVVKVAVEIPSD